MSDFWIRPDHILDLVGATLPLASTDGYLTSLNMAVLRRTGDHLTAIATDRYVVGMARCTLSSMDTAYYAPPDDWRLAIGVPDAKKLLTLARSYRKQKRHGLQFERVGSHYSIGAAELTIPADLEKQAGGFPDAEGLLLKMAAKNSCPIETFDLDPRKVHQFEAARRIFASQPSDPIVLRSCGDNSYTVQIGTDFLGVIMGYQPPADGWPALDVDSWKNLT